VGLQRTITLSDQGVRKNTRQAAVTSGCLYLVGSLSHGTERVDLGVEVARICRGHVRVLGARAPAHVVAAAGLLAGSWLTCPFISLADEGRMTGKSRSVLRW
jgi:hypothetical protein